MQYFEKMYIMWFNANYINILNNITIYTLILLMILCKSFHIAPFILGLLNKVVWHAQPGVYATAKPFVAVKSHAFFESALCYSFVGIFFPVCSHYVLLLWLRLIYGYIFDVCTIGIHKAFVAKLALDIQIFIKYIFNYKLQMH